jgi:hypothetical protein
VSEASVFPSTQFSKQVSAARKKFSPRMPSKKVLTSSVVHLQVSWAYSEYFVGRLASQARTGCSFAAWLRGAHCARTGRTHTA